MYIRLSRENTFKDAIVVFLLEAFFNSSGASVELKSFLLTRGSLLVYPIFKSPECAGFDIMKMKPSIEEVVCTY